MEQSGVHPVKLFTMPDKTSIVLVCSLLYDDRIFMKHEGCDCGMFYLPHDAIPPCFNQCLYGHYQTIGDLVESSEYYQYTLEQKMALKEFLHGYKPRQALGFSLS